VQTFEVTSGHEMAWTRGTTRLYKKLTCRADRLKTMVFYNNRSAEQQPEQKRTQGRASNVNYVRGPDHLQQLSKAGLPDNAKWKYMIIEPFSWCLGYKCEVEFIHTFWRT
jgi:hypothetical protein